MLLTIVICVGASTTIYAKLSPLMSDFVSAKPKTPPTQPPAVAAASVPTPPPPTSTPVPTPTVAPTPIAATQAAAAAPSAVVFTADYQVRGPRRVNFRTSPGTADADTIIESLDPGTQLQYLNQDDTSTGTRWMKFRTQDGTQGWMREIDVVPLNAGQ